MQNPNIDLKHLASLVIKEIKNLKGDNRLDITNIRNGENLAIAAAKNKSKGDLDMSDQRWHGSGIGNPQFTLIGDVTGSGQSPVVTTIADEAVTFAKMQQISGLKLLGNADSSVGEVEEITLGSNLSFTGTTLNATGGSGSGDSVAFNVAQTLHGFVVGDVVRLVSGSANTYTKAQADSASDAEVAGIVSVVLTANLFTLTTHGLVTVGVPVGTAGTVMFLDPSIAGALTSTEPTNSGQVSKPLAIITDSSTRMVFINWRGEILNGGSGGSGSPLTVEEVDGSPLVTNVNTIKVSNGTLTDDGGGVVTITTGGSGGGGMAVEDASGTVDGVNVTFTTTNSPVFVTVNGQTLVSGDGYTVAGTYTLTFDAAPTGRPHSFYNI